MLIAHVGWIFFIQVLISIIIVLWGYQRYAKRWSTSLGRDSVEGVYTRVDFIEGESAYYAISYRYTVSGKRYFGSISRSHLSFGLFSDIDENIEELKKEEENPRFESHSFARMSKFFVLISIKYGHWLKARQKDK